MTAKHVRLIISITPLPGLGGHSTVSQYILLCMTHSKEESKECTGSMQLPDKWDAPIYCNPKCTKVVSWMTFIKPDSHLVIGVEIHVFTCIAAGHANKV